jgi:hypothetical protein
MVVKGANWINRRPFDKSGRVVQTLQLLMRIMFRPADGFWDLKRGKRGNAIIGVVLMLMVFIILLIDIQFRSYQTAARDPKDVSLMIEITRIFGAWILWGVANYGVAAITEGEGFFKDVMMGTAYSMGPFLFFTPVITAISHVLARSERGYMNFVATVITYWSLGLIVLSVKHLHNFTTKKALISTGLSIFGMACIIGVMGLMYILTDGLVNTVREIIIEIAIRA